MKWRTVNAESMDRIESLNSCLNNHYCDDKTPYKPSVHGAGRARKNSLRIAAQDHCCWVLLLERLPRAAFAALPLGHVPAGERDRALGQFRIG